MFIVWGSKGYSKFLGESYIECECKNCNNEVNLVARKIGRKFTIFWIPLFSYSSRYYLVCPICGVGTEEYKENIMKAIVTD